MLLLVDVNIDETFFLHKGHLNSSGRFGCLSPHLSHLNPKNLSSKRFKKINDINLFYLCFYRSDTWNSIELQMDLLDYISDKANSELEELYFAP